MRLTPKERKYLLERMLEKLDYCVKACDYIFLSYLFGQVISDLRNSDDETNKSLGKEIWNAWVNHDEETIDTVFPELLSVKPEKPFDEETILVWWHPQDVEVRRNAINTALTELLNNNPELKDEEE